MTISTMPPAASGGDINGATRSPRLPRLILLLCAALMPFSSFGTEAPTELGILTPFYRSTQLQGQLIGMGLMEIPDYLVASDIDIAYAKKAGMAQEIPFVDTFTINRFLGGYAETSLKKFNLWDAQLGPRSMDYVVKNDDGSLRFRSELIKQRLTPYLEAGYSPQDITLDLDNIPQDLARSPDAGVWGQRSPPADLQQWSAAISHFASDIKSYLGASTSLLSFKTGAEFDEKASFNGTSADFFAYYVATDKGLHAVLPDAPLSPGEFTAMGTCAPQIPTCVYDTSQFLQFAAANQLKINTVPRSLHSFLNFGNAMPSSAVARAAESYAKLPMGITKEIHQFGLLNQPIGGADFGNDPAALAANWEFQTLMGLWETIKPRRVFHWGGVIQVGGLKFLNGSGYLRQVLSHYEGYRAFHLHTEQSPPPQNTELMVIGLTKANSSALIISSFSPQAIGAKQNIQIDLPSILPISGAGALKTLRYDEHDNVFWHIRDDLANDGNLNSQFNSCQCISSPPIMANDDARAYKMLAKNWPAYMENMKKSLRWNRSDPNVSLNNRHLSAALDANELLVIELTP